MTIPIKTPKKLIEVALPLDDINAASAREKSIRHGHPSTLHLWWARRPLAAARAAIFAQMVNDPGYERNLGRGVNKEKAKVERERIFNILRRLVEWENTNNESVLKEARDEILKSWRETCELNKGHPEASTLFNPEVLPEFHDPFAGGGAIPLEAARLGLTSYASDLNPVAVLINKAMIEIPARFQGKSPAAPPHMGATQTNIHEDWSGCRGLAEDVQRYGTWLREEAFKRIGSFYPKVVLPKDQGGEEATVIAWLWARTVKSPNPAFSHVDVPLASTFILSSKAGKDTYVEPVVTGTTYVFTVKRGTPTDAAKAGTSAGKRKGFICLISGTPIDYNYIRNEAKSGRMGVRLLAVVADGPKGRAFLPPTDVMETLALSAVGEWRPDIEMPKKHRNFQPPVYGMNTFGDIFTERQLLALNTLADLVLQVRDRVIADAKSAGYEDDGITLDEGGHGAVAYGDAISVYLAFLIDQVANHGSTICGWNHPNTQMRSVFSRQALPMTWDYAEANLFSDSSGSFNNLFERMIKGFSALGHSAPGFAVQADAARQTITKNKVVSTDPPYYDNICYADLSDFFYVWLRRTLRPIFPNLFATKAVPKGDELVASQNRHGSVELAEKFFLGGMTEAMNRLAQQAHPAFPTTIYYAFKQSDTNDAGTGNTGWETFLEAVIRAGFAISGTWPVRTEKEGRSVGIGANALASSIILVCRPRSADATTASRRDFIRELKEELKEAVDAMIGGAEGISPVAPVDLAQAVIGPGMAIFSKHSAVLEADGSPMTVHTALTLINNLLTEGGDEYDSNTQFCLVWFDEQGWTDGEFGKADVLARAKGTSVDSLKESGVVKSGAGTVRLLKVSEYPSGWSPEQDNNTPVWEALHQVVRAHREQSESAAGALLAGMPQRADQIRNLAYRLYTLCERKSWVDDARAYNELITSWTGIESASHEKGHLDSQANLDI